MKLKTLKLTNFEGIKSLEINADGKSLSIYGDNGTGKTTIADAQAWLLFDKDSGLTPNFLPKPRNTDGEEMHNVDTEVEGTYILEDSVEITFRKVFAESWKKRRGSTEATFSGHTISYYIDGVPKKETEYNAYLESIADIRMLMLLSMPQYFAEILDIKKRRELLMSLAGNIDDFDIINANEDLKPLMHLMLKPGATANWYDMAEFIQIEKAAEKKANADLKDIPGRIDEATRSMSGVKENHVDEVKKELGRLNAKKVALQLEATANESQMTQSLKADIAAKTAKLEEKRAEYLRKSTEDNAEIRKKVGELYDKYMEQMNAAKAARQDHNDKLAAVERLRVARNELLQQWQEVSASQWNGDTICPTCGQPIPEDKIEEAKAQFNENKSVKLEILNKEGKKCSKELIATMEAEAEVLNSKAVSAEAAANKTSIEREKLKALIKDVPPFESTDTYAEIKRDIDTTQAQIDALQDCKDAKIAEKKAEIAEIENQICELNIEVAKFDADCRIRERIKELEVQEKACAETYAKARQGLDLAELFGQKKAEMLTDKINAHFDDVRFRLFKVQINGGIADDCEVMALTSAGYIPYSTANNAARINAGLEIIKGFAKVNENTSMPVFVDNAESVTKLKDDGLQIIRLVVSEQDKVLRIETEEK